MEIKAKSNFIRLSPQKLNLVAQTLKGLKVEQALVILKNLPHKAAGPLILLLKQGVGNAVNNYDLEKESLLVKELMVGKGPILKRGRPVSRGQWHARLKRTSHLELIITGVKKQTKKKGAQNGKKRQSD
jgi:large subunit ribosomal protein L22